MKFPAGRYVDVHTHLGTVWNTGQELTAEELLRLDGCGRYRAGRCVPLVSPESSSYPISSDYVLDADEAVSRSADPLLLGRSTHELTGGHAGLVAMLRRYVDAGARGFGEHKPGVTIDDPRNMALYAACAGTRSCRCCFISTNSATRMRPGLPGLEHVLSEH